MEFKTKFLKITETALMKNILFELIDVSCVFFILNLGLFFS